MKWVKSEFKGEEDRIRIDIDDYFELFDGYKMQYVDDVLSSSCWQNDTDTIVFRIKDTDPHFAYAIGRLRPDEIDYLEDGQGYFIFRLWWD